MKHESKIHLGLRARLLAMTAIAGVSAALAWPTADARAAGFAIKEQSGSAQGNSFAGATAGAEDISYMFFNPAGLSLHDGNQIIVVGSYILPGNDTDNATLSAVIPWTNGESSENGGENAAVPALYAMWSATPDLKVGLGINAPFGLKTEYSQTWAGRYHAVESDMKTLNINPVVAYRINPTVSIAAGLQAEHMEATLSNMVPTLAGDALFEINGDGWAYGFTLGAMFELSPKTRIGLGYRSELDHDVDGTATFGNTLFTAIPQTGGTSVTVPQSAHIGIYHELSDTLAIMGELQWMGWSSLDQLVVTLDSGGFGFGDTLTQNYNWDDVWFAGIGATWKASDQWAIRTGIAYDQSPIPEATRTPRIPGSDRTWLSVGASFNVNPSFTIDAGYTHIFMDNAQVSIADQTGGGGLPGLDATFENKVDIFALQVVVNF